MITMNCPGCGRQNTLSEELAGVSMNCEQCGELFRVSSGIRPVKVRKPDLVAPTRSEQEAQAKAFADYKHDAYGTWCPHCGNRCSVKSARGVAVVVVLTVLFTVLAGLSSSPLLAIIPIAIGLVLGAFLPREWKCYQCQHVWRA